MQILCFAAVVFVMLHFMPIRLLVLILRQLDLFRSGLWRGNNLCIEYEGKVT